MLGVAKPGRTTLSILLSPVGPYFPTGLKPISLFVDEQHRWGASLNRMGLEAQHRVVSVGGVVKRLASQLAAVLDSTNGKAWAAGSLQQLLPWQSSVHATASLAHACFARSVPASQPHNLV